MPFKVNKIWGFLKAFYDFCNYTVMTKKHSADWNYLLVGSTADAFHANSIGLCMYNVVVKP